MAGEKREVHPKVDELLSPWFITDAVETLRNGSYEEMVDLGVALYREEKPPCSISEFTNELLERVKEKQEGDRRSAEEREAQKPAPKPFPLDELFPPSE